MIKRWKEDARFLDTLGFDVPACEIVLEDAKETLLRVVALFCTGEQSETLERKGGDRTDPKRRSGKAMKSVMRSSMLLGSRTKVGKATRERSIPTLRRRSASTPDQ